MGAHEAAVAANEGGERRSTSALDILTMDFICRVRSVQVKNLFIDKIEFEEVNGPRILCGVAAPFMTSVNPVSLCQQLKLRVSEGHARFSVCSDTSRLTVHVPVYEHPDFLIGKHFLIL